MPKDQIYVRAHYRSRGTARPKWVAYHPYSRTFLQPRGGQSRYPPTQLAFRNDLKRRLGPDWADDWTLLAVR